MDIIWQEIKATWESAGLRVPPGVPTEQLDSFENLYLIVLPASMRDFFQVANGTGEMDSFMYTFWPLDALKPISDVFKMSHADDTQYFLFADWLLQGCQYAVHLTPEGGEGPVYMISKHGKYRVADSFLAFMRTYYIDPHHLY